MSVEVRVQRQPRYTRKVWNLVARVICDAISTQHDRERLARLFSKIFEEDSPYFRAEKFRRLACGYDKVGGDIKHHPKGGKRSEESFD